MPSFANSSKIRWKREFRAVAFRRVSRSPRQRMATLPEFCADMACPFVALGNQAQKGSLQGHAEPCRLETKSGARGPDREALLAARRIPAQGLPRCSPGELLALAHCIFHGAAVRLEA